MSPPGKQKSPGATAKREIVVVAKFSRPKASLKEEIVALDNGNWNPSDEDVHKVADYDSPNGTPAKPYNMKDRSITAVGLSGTQGKGFRHLLTSSNLRTIKSPMPIP